MKKTSQKINKNKNYKNSIYDFNDSVNKLLQEIDNFNFDNICLCESIL